MNVKRREKKEQGELGDDEKKKAEQRELEKKNAELEKKMYDEVCNECKSEDLISRYKRPGELETKSAEL